MVSMESQRRATSLAGTTGCKAPETYDGGALPASDVFGFAVIAYRVASLAIPFRGLSEQQIRAKLEPFRASDAQARRGLSPEQQYADWLEDYPLETRRPAMRKLDGDGRCPSALKELVVQAWADNPLDRPLFPAIIDIVESMLCGMLPAREYEAAAFSSSSSSSQDASTILAAVKDLQIDLMRQHNEDLIAIEKVGRGVDNIRDKMAAVADAVEANRALINERVGMLANRITTSGGSAQEVPWLFSIFPDDRNKRAIKRPKAWLKKELRIHLMCNGRRDLGVHPHFLFTAKDELHGKPPHGLYRGYRLLEATKTLRKWAPVLKVLLGALSMAAKFAASAAVPGLGNAIPGLKMLFEDDDAWDDATEDATDDVHDKFSAVCNALISDIDDVGPEVHDGLKSSSSSAGSSSRPGSSWGMPEEAEFKRMQDSLAEFILKRDQKHRKELKKPFFGLRMCHNTKRGAGSGDGTPIWLCPHCYPPGASDTWTGDPVELPLGDVPGLLRIVTLQRGDAADGSGSGAAVTSARTTIDEGTRSNSTSTDTSPGGDDGKEGGRMFGIVLANDDVRKGMQGVQIQKLEQRLETANIEFTAPHRMKAVVDTRANGGGLGLEISHGTKIIAGIKPNSNAAAALGYTLAVGDTIVAVNGIELEEVTHDGTIALLKSADVVTLEFVPSSAPPAAAGHAQQLPGSVLAQRNAGFGIKLNDHTPLIASVDAGSPADVQGLEPGDLIVSIEGKPLRYNTPVEVVAALLKAAKPTFGLQVSRLVDQAAKRAGVNAGDVIVAIDGVSALSMPSVDVEARLLAAAASNEPLELAVSRSDLETTGLRPGR